MARTRRTFYTSRRRTAKWSSHLLVQPLTFESAAGDFASYQLIAKNSTDTTVPVPNIIKVKNFRVSIDTTAPGTFPNIRYFNVYLMYIPEGITINTDTPKNHPEWILGWRGINDTNTSDQHTLVITSRLARNLNSGDGIYLVFGGYAEQAITANFACTTSYVSRAN